MDYFSGRLHRLAPLTSRSLLSCVTGRRLAFLLGHYHPLTPPCCRTHPWVTSALTTTAPLLLIASNTTIMEWRRRHYAWRLVRLAGGHEVAGHIEDGLSSWSIARSDEGDRESAAGTELHGHGVGAVITEREVESGTGRVVGGGRADEQIAAGGLPGHGQVAGDRGGAGEYAPATCHRERPGGMVGEGTGQTACAVTGVEQACRSQGDVDRSRHVRCEVAGDIEDRS